MTEVPPPTRTFEDASGRAWRAEVAGRDRTGKGGDVGAPLLLLLFRPEEDDEGEPTVLEKLVVAAELDDLSDPRLAEILEEAKPSDFRPGELFPGTRRGRGS